MWVTDQSSPPTRAEIDDIWSGVAEGRLSREDGHNWAEPLMLAERPSDDAMVMSALQNIHGLDMTYRSDDQRFVGHGPPGRYLRSLEQVTADLEHWRSKCREHDADPEAWAARNRERARQYLQESGEAP